MATLPPSISDNASAFDLLHPKVQRWIWQQGWDELRDVQASAIHTILNASGDVVITAATASGKTEAAFLPILSAVADIAREQLCVLYVSPLKALINDQFGRLESLCEDMEIDVVRWHGDAPQSKKAALLKRPRGIALITPESIEALLDRRAAAARRLFSGLRFVVVDELHAFLQGPRGLHLFSLLHRIETFAPARPRRVGLSATLGDMQQAKAWLNAAAPDGVHTIASRGGGPGIDLKIRAFVEPPRRPKAGVESAADEDQQPTALEQIAEDLFLRLRGANNLVFAGSRQMVEALADNLRVRSDDAHVPNEFLPHHGSLSKELRESLEHRLKQGSEPTTAIATTTLELGIDIGSIKSVALIGAPRSMSSLRQKLGRSGRRKGVSAILRIYLRCPHIDEGSDILDRLSVPVALSSAAIGLLAQRVIEPPSPDPNVATVVLHQILSVICERGGARADELHRDLCAEGPLSALGTPDFIALLRSMASVENGLIEQGPDGTILLGPTGEKLTAGHDFYAIFPSDAEWRLVHDGVLLGTLPLSNSVGEGSVIGFAGRRWRITAVDDAAKILLLEPHPSTKLPMFEGNAEGLPDLMVAAVREAYRSSELPPWLDETARRRLDEARRVYADNQLDTRALVATGRAVHWFTWRGSGLNSALAACLRIAGFSVDIHDLGVTFLGVDENEIREKLARQTPGELTAETIAARVKNLSDGKFDHFIDENLLRRLWARRNAGYAQEAIGLVGGL